MVSLGTLMDFGGNSLKLDYEKSVFVPEILRVRNFVNIMQIREGNEEGMGRGSKKPDYGGFFVLQIPVPEKREILIG